MPLESTFDILNDFSSDKIIKLFQRFNISITDDELHDLIKQSFSINQLSNSLLSKFRPSQIVKDNINRYLTRYWELQFPNKNYLEKLILEINKKILDTKKETPIGTLFSDSIELFGKITAFTSHFKNPEEFRNFTDFYAIVKSWLVKALSVIIDLQDYPENIVNIVNDFYSFMEMYFDPNDQSELRFPFTLVNCMINATKVNQAETEDCMTSLQKQSFSPLGVYLCQLTFLRQNLTINPDYDLLKKFHNWLKEKSIFGNINQLEALVLRLEQLRTYLDKKQSREIQSSIETLKNIQKDLETDSQSHTNHLDTSISEFQANCRLFPLVAFSTHFIESKMVELYSDQDIEISLQDVFEAIINRTLTIKLNIECPNCGILYPINVKQVLFPPNWKDLVKNKNNKPDNGKIFFKEEITCPVCQSFKFVLNYYSKLFLINFLSYLNEKFVERTYDIKNLENPVVLVSIDSKLIKKVKDIDEAIAKVDSLLKKHKNDFQCYKEKAVFMISLNDYNQAKKLFNTVLSIDPTDVQSLCYLIKIAHGRDQKDQSKKLIVELMEVVNTDSSLFIPNFSSLREINEIVLSLKDSKLTRDYKRFLQE